jgi:hypothetical protein
MKTTGNLLQAICAATFAIMVASAPIAAIASPLNVYWTSRNAATVHKTVVASTTTTQLVAPTGGRLQDVDLDAGSNTLYFSDWGVVGGANPNEGAIHRVQTDGSGLATVIGGGALKDAVHQLHLDTANNHIYFTRAVSYADRELSRVDTSGANYTPLRQGFDFSDADGWFYSGLAVDTANNAIYWGDIGVFNPAPPADGALNTMTLTGAAPTTLVPHLDGKGRGMVLDQATQTLFYTSHDVQNPDLGGSVFSYDIANGIETLLPISNPNNYGFWDIEIDQTMNRIWWTVNDGGAGAGEIWSSNIDGSGQQVELTGLTDVYGLALEFVPEPSTLTLATLALLGISCRRRKRA